MALFHLLELECIAVRNDGMPKHPAYSGKKGLRELRGLASTVNYDGLSSRRRNRGSLNGSGAISVYK